MNLELNAIKEELAVLKNEFSTLKDIVKISEKSQYFVIYYELEYIEPIDIQKLLREMIEPPSSFPIDEIYTIVLQESDKTYENPLLNIYRYIIKATLFLKCTEKMSLHTLDFFFENKLGKVFVDYYYSSSEFLKTIKMSMAEIDGHYKIEKGTLVKQVIVK